LDISDIAVLIPALEPDERLPEYVTGLINAGFSKIIVVNDGSSDLYDKYFDECRNAGCIVLKHAVNQGKGRSLKTGINYYLNNFDRQVCGGIVTADSDGQHSVQDTVRIAKALTENKDSLILGTRDFKLPDVPFKSRSGNTITTKVFETIYKEHINDTQTGLRGIPDSFLEECMKLSGERYEYEISMLISAVRHKIDIRQETISTIYYDDNKGTHFDPVKDSLKIYAVIFTKNFVIHKLKEEKQKKMVK
jgi:glycosyltransferase involved in cell wall biosynthesis